MIWLYTGTPGSGKSLHAARDIVARSKRGGGLICNFPLDLSIVKNVKSDVIYWDNSEITVERLKRYAYKNHKIGKENQTLIVIDEAQVKFNCRDFGVKDRNSWVEFFCQHRKLGYNVILITQNDRMLDKQIRALVEYEIKHRKMNNYGIGGMLLSLTMTTWFASVEYWYGMKGQDARLGFSMFPYSKKYSKIYDSYMLFDDARSDAGGDRSAVGSPGEAPGLPKKSVIISKGDVSA